MANERITEGIVRDHFKDDPLFKSIKFEEQKSYNKRVIDLLQNASKRGKGVGKPEFIISFPTSKIDYLIVIECKASVTSHKSANLDKPQDYAVDGVLHYAKTLSQEFDVVAIAISGQTEQELEVSHFLWKKQKKNYIEKTDKKLLSINDYIKLFDNEQFAEKLKYTNIVLRAIELNEEYNNYSIPEQDRNTMVSIILLSLLHQPFRDSFSSETSVKSLADSLIRAVENALALNEVRYRDAMINEFKKIFVQPIFVQRKIKNKKEKEPKYSLSVLKEMILYLYKYVYPLTKMEDTGFDVLGQFYTEFIRYSASQQKQGLVLTPFHITDLFCDLAQLNVNDIIYDPCCGTAGFLVSGMKRLFVLAGSDDTRKQRIRKEQLIGVEMRPSMYAYACSNMLLKGDGKSNIYCGDCFQMTEDIKKHKPTFSFLNPPYDVGNARQMEFIEHALDIVAPQNGRVVAIVQMSCALKNDKELITVKNRLLQKHHLKAVLSMPDDLFYPVGVVTCAMVFEAGKRNNGLKTWFGYFKDDGFEKRKNQGRIDARNKFKSIKNRWLDIYYNSEEIAGLSVKQEVGAKDEWCAEAYLETDYSTLCANDFVDKMRNYTAFRLLHNDDPNAIYEISSYLNEKYSLNTEFWKWFRYDHDDVFDIKKGFYNKKPDADINGTIPFIGATDSNNGITSWHDRGNIELTSKTGREPNAPIGKKIFRPNCITVSNNGSVGFAFYQPNEFTCTHDVNPLYLKGKELNVYIAMFLCTLIEKEQYRWAYGRKWRPVRMPSSLIKLPVTPDGKPDWQFMENYIKSLPYSKAIDNNQKTE
jgi:type I restriction-modification system DNA methylase subunit